MCSVVIILVIISCISIVALIIACLSYTKTCKDNGGPTPPPVACASPPFEREKSNQGDSNLIKIPLYKSDRTTYDIKSGGYLFITKISNLKPNCPVRLTFNDLWINLPVDINGNAYPGGKKGQPLMLSLMPYNDVKLHQQDKWTGETPMGTFSSFKITDVLPSNIPKKFEMLLVNSLACNYSPSSIETKTAIILNGSFGMEM